MSIPSGSTWVITAVDGPFGVVGEEFTISHNGHGTPATFGGSSSTWVSLNPVGTYFEVINQGVIVGVLASGSGNMFAIREKELQTIHCSIETLSVPRDEIGSWDAEDQGGLPEV